MNTKIYYIYLIETECGKLYCGITDNVEKRFLKHKSGKGAKFTRSFKPKRIAAAWITSSRENALKIEIMIKKLARDEKEILIAEELSLPEILKINPEDYSLTRFKINENDFQ